MYFKIKHLLILLVIISGLIIGIFLIKNPKVFKSKAAIDSSNIIDIVPSSDSNTVEYDPDADSFKTDSQSVRLRFTPDGIEELKK